MKVGLRRSAVSIVCVSVLLVQGACVLAARGPAVRHTPAFATTTGAFAISFKTSGGTLEIRPRSMTHGLAVTELGGVKASNVLNGVNAVRHSGHTYTLTGHTKWTGFSLRVQMIPSVPGLVHLQLALAPTRDAPVGSGNSPDIRLETGGSSSITEYAPATPVAGNAVYLGIKSLKTTALYWSNYTALGAYFDRTKSGASQPNFSYPGAEGVGSLVGVVANKFGYEPPSGSLDNLAHRKSTVAVDSFLYLVPGLPNGEADEADRYLRMMSTVFTQIPQPSVPAADWTTIAAATGRDLADPANLVSVGGHQYLRSYVSDTRTAPELITQAGVLAGMKAYEAASHSTLALDSVLDANLSSFYDSTYHTVTNSLPHSADARDESWYYVDNLISLLQLAQEGDPGARKLLLDSVPSVITLAHANTYEFPVSFQYGVWSGKGSAVQPDVAGGYAWLMLGLYDLTNDATYLNEAKASIAHVAGKGFTLSYELHMTAYTAAAAQRLFRMTGDAAYHADAELALANLFHATRLWDCTYGLCRKGSGYHTYMGLDPLPTGDYVAMLEQYEAWLGLRGYARYDSGEPAYITNLVNAFLSATPRTMQYSLPPQLPSGVAATSPGLYDFVRHNNLSWQIPLEDLREGELNSGSIGQETYGAGGPFFFAADGS